MLSDEELRAVYGRAAAPAVDEPGDHVAGLRAVEAAVRADQAIECNNARFDLLRELAAAQAVIARAGAANAAPHANTKQSNSRMTAVDSALAGSPVDVLQAHDREVAATTLVTYAEALEENPSAEVWGQADFVADARDWATHIEAGTLNAPIVSEPSTPALGVPVGTEKGGGES